VEYHVKDISYIYKRNNHADVWNKTVLHKEKERKKEKKIESLKKEISKKERKEKRLKRTNIH
jgi:hypothetical protein